MLQTQGEVTQLLAAVRDGSPGAVDRLVELVYAHWHRLAERLLDREADMHSLQPTALLNEALVRILEGDLLHQAPNRFYFFKAASRVMGHILVEHARRRRSLSRGGKFRRLPFDVLLDYYDKQRIDVVALRNALDVLAGVHERAAVVMTLRTIGGYTADEVARQLEVSVSTVEKDTQFARAWLRKELGGDRDDPHA